MKVLSTQTPIPQIIHWWGRDHWRKNPTVYSTIPEQSPPETTENEDRDAEKAIEADQSLRPIKAEISEPFRHFEV